jgi:hypothetical protein
MVQAEALARTTQTNEPGRSAAILPLLATIDGPVALLEVGASAGLCLYPDRYSYEYVTGASVHRLDPAAGPSPVVLLCEMTGEVTGEMAGGLTGTALTLPTEMPHIVWRAGIDLAPLDVANPADLRWLQMLVGPEQQDRRDRIAAAAQIVREDPPYLVAGDVTEALAAVASSAPPDATLVVLVVGVLVYLGPQQRAEFTGALTTLSDRGARWISLEDPAVFPAMAETLARHPAPAAGLFPLALDGSPVAWCSPHGRSIAWMSQR